jgi:transcription elongation factor Elf1
MQERARRDPHQAVLANSGIDKNPSLYTVIESSMAINPKKKVTCPFCLGLSEFRLFLVSGKKGISLGTAKCPLCGLTFRMKSLVCMAKWTAKEYADWVFEYSHAGFWTKVKFDTWKKRLYLMRWTEEFWERYHELKGEDKDESYTDYVDRSQREEAMEKGWTDPQETGAQDPV